jgi:hypothetical protein
MVRLEEEEAPPLGSGGIVGGDTARRSTRSSGRGLWPPVLLRTEARTAIGARHERHNHMPTAVRDAGVAAAWDRDEEAHDHERWRDRLRRETN